MSEEEVIFCNRTISRPPIDWVAHSVNLYIIPMVCGFGSLAALLCVVVFSKKQMRSSLNVYLAGLSMFDLVLLSMSLIIYTPMQTCVEQGRGGSAVCHFFWKSTLFTYPISLIAQTGSVWTCVAVTVDRFLAVSYPLHSKIWCTPKRALAILCTITFLSILYRIPSSFELTLSECGELTQTELRKHSVYVSLYINYGYLLVMLVFPWSIMIIFNTFVVLAVHRAYKFRRSLQSTKNQEEKDRRCTIMALCMILTFVIFNAMAAMNNVIESFEFDFDPRLMRFMIPMANLFVCLNSASNIIIYSLFGARFRQVCVLMLCGRHSRWMVWLRAGKQIVSDFDGRDGATRRTSLDASTALVSARNSQRWSQRSAHRASQSATGRRPTVVTAKMPNRLSLQQASL